MTTNYFEMGVPEDRPMNDNEIVDKALRNCEDYICDKHFETINDIKIILKNAISLTRQSERQNMIKMIDDIIEEIHTTGDFKLKNRIQILESLKSQLQSPVAQNSKEDTSELHENGASAVMPSGLQTQECYICHNRDLTGKKLKCPNCGNNSQEKNEEKTNDTLCQNTSSKVTSVTPDTQTLSDKIRYAQVCPNQPGYELKEWAVILPEDVKDAIKKWKNKIHNWEMASLDDIEKAFDEIFGPRLVKE